MQAAATSPAPRSESKPVRRQGGALLVCCQPAGGTCVGARGRAMRPHEFLGRMRLHPSAALEPVFFGCSLSGVFLREHAALHPPGLCGQGPIETWSWGGSGLAVSVRRLMCRNHVFLCSACMAQATMFWGSWSRVGASALLLRLALGRFCSFAFLERPLCCRSAAAEVLRYITPMWMLMLWLCPH